MRKPYNTVTLAGSAGCLLLALAFAALLIVAAVVVRFVFRMIQAVAVGVVLSVGVQLATWDAVLSAAFGPAYWVVIDLVRMAGWLVTFQ